MFDDSRLESPELTDSETLRWLATAGARIRRAAQTRPIGHLDRADRPRGILVLGTEARLVRAVLEPACPVPFMAWPGPGLPAWLRSALTCPVGQVAFAWPATPAALAAALKAEGIGALIHYPIPPHRQAAYQSLHLPAGTFPIAERLADHVLSLPIGPLLSADQARTVVGVVRHFFAG